MRRILGLVAAWTTATLVAVAVAAAAVGSVRTEVTDAPTALGTPSLVVVAAPEGIGPDTPSIPTTTVPVKPTTTSEDLVVVETMTTITVAPLDLPTGSTTTTTSPPPTATASTTTTTTKASYTKTYDTEAGSVRIVVSGDSVTFAGATPLPGWTVELENSGPEEVKVHFERNEDAEEEIEFKAKVEDGELKISISESEDD